MWFGLVCEGPSDQRTVTRLVERVLSDEVHWLIDSFSKFIGWRGVLGLQDFTSWAGEKGIKGLARDRNLRVHGEFSGQPGSGEALQATKAIRLFKDAQLNKEIDGDLLAIFLIRDTDGDPERRPGLKQARVSSDTNFEIVLGLPHTKRECWILVAFEPEDADDDEALGNLRAALGFDPTEHAQKLTAQKGGAKKNAKRVLNELLQGEHRREDELIESSIIDDLEAAGADVGLAEFIEEIRTRVAPH